MARRRPRASQGGAPAAPPHPAPSAPPAFDSATLQTIAGVVVLLIGAFVVYAPALHGGMLWDDSAHITKPILRSLPGLYHIWFTLGATQQYYPLLHSVFWFEWQLFGDATFPYHVVNVVEHASAACLLWGVLRRLQVPGAFLAAALFVVHPVYVESVAWITEQKNTLSAVFYLAAAWCYVKFDEHAPSEYSYPWGVRMSRPPGWYLLALAFFVLGLLTKTVTATLPAALLVVFWWKRGRLSLARDVLPLAPWFAIGASAGLVTAWSERVLIGAQGAEFAFGVPFRIVLAGRVVWFYLGKLLWPSDLMFFYPRWAVDPSSWVWWTYPVAVVATAALLLAIAVRTGRRAPLAAFLLFVGTLFPALGFLNVYPFRFSYVADHFQYLAGLGILALVSAVLVRIARRGPAWRYPVVVVSLTLVATLGVLARKQSDQYGHDAVYHYRTMIRQNPDVWLAYGNLGWLLSEQKQYDEAMRLFRKALELNPRHFESIRDLGLTYLQMGKPQEAAEWFTRALEFDPDPKAGENRLGNALVRGGRAAEAIPHLQRAIAIATSEKTTIPLFHLDLGLGYRAVQRYDEAIAEFERARTLAGGRYPLATAMLADTQVLLKRYDEAVPNLRRAIDDDPDDAIHRFDLGRILFNARQFSEARPYLEEAIRLRPDLVDAYIVLAMTRFELGDRTDAREIALNGLRAARSVLPPEAVQQIERTLAPILNQ